MGTYKIKVKGINQGEVISRIYNFTPEIDVDSADIIFHLDKISWSKSLIDNYDFDLIINYDLYTPKKRNKKFTVKELIDTIEVDEPTLSIFNETFPKFEPLIKSLPAQKQIEIVFLSIEESYNLLSEKSKALRSDILDISKPKFEVKPARENPHDNYYGAKVEFNDKSIIIDKLKSAFNDKKILFIENDGCLSEDIADFYQWVLKENIEHYCLFNAKNAPLDYIAAKINEFDMIAYQSQYVRDTTFKLIEYVKALKTPKTILECYIHEPHFYTLPDNIVHDMYILTTTKDLNEWELDKLETGKMYWDNE